MLLRCYLLNTETLGLLLRLLRNRLRLMDQLRCQLNALLNRVTLWLNMFIDYLMLLLLWLPVDYLMSRLVLQYYLCRRLMS